MKNKYIIANWKTNPDSIEKAKKLLQITADFNTKQKAKKEKSQLENFTNFEIAHAVPAIYASALALESKEIFVQDIFHKEDGAYTGKFGAKMAKSVGVYMSIVGHSETRENKQNKKGYTDTEIAEKVRHLIDNKMWACLCVGEEVRNKNYREVIKKQILDSLSLAKASDYKNLCLAYEPVWAIGKDAKRPATNSEISETIEFIKEVLAEKFGAKNSKSIIVLYGGSVDKTNIKEINDLDCVGGFLIGRASSDAKKWEGLLSMLLK